MGFMSTPNSYRAEAATAPSTNYGMALDTMLSGADQPIDLSQSNATSAQQKNLNQMLMARAQGQGTSPAEIQAKQNQDRINQQTAGALTAQRGMSPALAARMILQQQSAGSQQNAAQGAQLRAQETMGAQNTLAQSLNAQRGQDISQGLGAYGAGTQRMGTLGGLQTQQRGQDINAQMTAQQVNAQIAQANAKSQSDVIGGTMSGIASVGAAALLASDGVKVPKNLKSGGAVDGQAKVAGDSPTNDTVPAMLSPGEVVIPRTMADDGDKAKHFVNALKAGKSPKQAKAGYGKVVEAQRKMNDRLSRLEQMLKQG